MNFSQSDMTHIKLGDTICTKYINAQDTFGSFVPSRLIPHESYVVLIYYTSYILSQRITLQSPFEEISISLFQSNSYSPCCQGGRHWDKSYSYCCQGGRGPCWHWD